MSVSDKDSERSVSPTPSIQTAQSSQRKVSINPLPIVSKSTTLSMSSKTSQSITRSQLSQSPTFESVH